ncbi:MAG TPA: methyltransferase [Myxococcota bacterium]|nr:methyltransferase [Myxococcota bacterium]
MEPFRYHLFVCDQRKPEGAPCCSANGSVKVIEALRREIGKQGLAEEVQVTTCGSLGLCERGPNMVVYPEGVWYSRVRPEDVPEIVREHLAGGRVVVRLVSGDRAALRSEIDGNKRKMLAAFEARDKAGVLPDELNNTIRGFQESRIVLTAIELDLFSAVGDGADASTLARQMDTDRRATESLLNALVAMELLEKRDGTYSNGPAAACFLAAGGQNDSRAAIMHSVHLWPRWSTLTECVRRGTSVTYQEMSGRGDEWTTAFIAAMHKNAVLRAPMVVRAVGLEGVQRVLDVGGGSGAYAIAFAQAGENIRADVLDLPTVVPLAQRHIDEAGLDERVKTRIGDLRTDDLGSGYDLVFISAICHMLDPDGNRELLDKSFKALSSGGRVVIQDFILNSNKTGPKTAALFALNMLVGTSAGGTYSEREYTGWLQGAGFMDVNRVALAGPTDMIVAVRP